MDSSFDQPVLVIVTDYTFIHAGLAEVKVTLLTNATVEMFVGNGLATLIAIDAERCTIEVMQSW